MRINKQRMEIELIKNVIRRGEFIKLKFLCEMHDIIQRNSQKIKNRRSETRLNKLNN
jgi:hypothetical protein